MAAAAGRGDRIRVCIAGFGGRGVEQIDALVDRDDAWEVVGVADRTVLDLWDTPDEARFKVAAEGGAVRWEKMRKGWVESKGDPLPIPVDPVDERLRTGLWAQDLHFVEAVRSGREPALPAATLKDALGTMVLIERILGDSLGSAAAPEAADPARASDPVQRAVLQPD